MRVTDRAEVRSMRMGLEIAVILHKLYPTQFDPAKLITLLGDEDTVTSLKPV